MADLRFGATIGLHHASGDYLNLKPQRLWALFLLSSLLLAAGCSRANATPDATEAATAIVPGGTAIATPSPQPSPTATLTPEPTPISPSVTISDQSLDESGVLRAEQVALPASGWLVIFRVLDGKVDDVIGRLPLAAGVHNQVEVTVDAAMATEQLVAGVHADAGTAGVFEYPGVDKPFPGEPEAEFSVELLLPKPQIEVSDQAIAEDGVMLLARAELLEPTWVVVHADHDGEIGAVVGSRLFPAGEYENAPITINWRRATPVLHVVLHEDGDDPGVLDYPAGDMPLLNGGQPIVAAFHATFPPEVLVYDQPIIDGTISIERAISDGPGYVAVYNEVEGQPGFIIGTAALEDGLNEHIPVTLLEPAITTQLFARLHHDTEPGDAFNFPGQDPPVLFNNRLPNASAFRTDNGALVFVEDQRLTEDGGVIIDVVISPRPAWAAVYREEDGGPGDLLGQTWLPAGVNRDVVVALDGAPESGPLYLIMYQDLGVAEEFEAPGTDVELRDGKNQPIRVPFSLLPR